jgi:hypothetical protein
MAASHYIHYDALLHSVMITRIPVLVLLELTECSSSKCGYISGISQICVILYLLRGKGKFADLLQCLQAAERARLEKEIRDKDAREA